MLMRNRTDRSKTRAYSIHAISKAVFLALPILALSVQMALASDGILKASPQPKQQKPEQAQAERITIATPSELIEIDVVNQIIDLNAKSSYQAFRFEPDYLWLKPGTVVRFKGSTGRHTVSSVRGMYPKGAKPFEIRGRPKMDIAFDKEGVYGIRCRVHGRHGMAMLIIVGDPNVNLEKARSQKVGKKEAVKFKRLFERLDKDLANRS
ncbi:MAG: hypothetical protein OIF58_08595 [Cohaesibacter sp.]|nr:hypothetical protein [Cohaesibacter sp.]